ncbi:hypothetical protein [Erythrobacter sp. HKB08]|uniref:hypothetical protein n=1 Tax=Erythrobacter sp. HKB08 TaxID=2502843 RepID=UPI0013E8F40D|nr:hypothetical protein [Erythrobacter sp. HKB08]
MIIREELAKLRSDPAPQHQAQAALEHCLQQWREAEGRELLRELAEYGAGRSLGECPALTVCLADGEHIASLVRSLIECLARHPFGHVPMRHQLSDGVGLIEIAQAGRSALGLVLHERDCVSREPSSAAFADLERHELLLAGRGRAVVLERLDGAAPHRTELPLEKGSRLSLAGTRRTKVVREVREPIVTLRLTRTPERPETTEEVCCDTGRVLHRAASNREESCDEMAIALLTAMERCDAIPQIAEKARRGSSSLRWQALRHSLALDTGIGLGLLSDFARTSDDPLAEPARRLLQQLGEREPGGAQCLAN